MEAHMKNQLRIWMAFLLTGMVFTSAPLEVRAETGWYHDTAAGYWYYHAETGALAADGWKKIGNYWYYFNADGILEVSRRTPDGYFVNADGVWMPEYGKETAEKMSDQSDTQKGSWTGGLPNPMVEYESEAEVRKVLGYDPLQLPGTFGYTLRTKYIIAGDLADYRYANSAGDEFSVRTSTMSAAGRADISGHYDVSWAEKAMDGISVSWGSSDTGYAAFWQYGSYAFSADAGNLGEAEFLTDLEKLVCLSRAY